MMDVLVADPATETVNLNVEQAKGAVERRLIDNLVRATVAGNLAARDQLLAEVYALALRYCRYRLRRSPGTARSRHRAAPAPRSARLSSAARSGPGDGPRSASRELSPLEEDWSASFAVRLVGDQAQADSGRPISR